MRAPTNLFHLLCVVTSAALAAGQRGAVPNVQLRALRATTAVERQGGSDLLLFQAADQNVGNEQVGRNLVARKSKNKKKKKKQKTKVSNL